MERITENRLEKNEKNLIGNNLNTDLRIKIFANLIIDRIIEDKKRGVIHSTKELCTKKEMQLPL